VRRGRGEDAERRVELQELEGRARAVVRRLREAVVDVALVSGGAAHIVHSFFFEGCGCAAQQGFVHGC
jgi:phosphoserine phosphatase